MRGRGGAEGRFERERVRRGGDVRDDDVNDDDVNDVDGYVVVYVELCDVFYDEWWCCEWE